MGELANGGPQPQDSLQDQRYRAPSSIARIFAAVLGLVSLAGLARAAVPVWGGELVALPASSSANSASATLTLGASGANSLLIVVIDAVTNFSAPVISYNGLSMTALGATVAFGTIFRRVYYITHPVSGQTLSIANGAPTTLNTGGSVSWQYQWLTYSGVSELAPFGTTDISAGHSQISSSGSPVSVAFSFTPSSAGSTILQMGRIQGSTCSTSYASVNGTVRRSIQQQNFGGAAAGWAFSDYAPGSTSAFSLSQSWNPAFCSSTFYAWGIELLPVGPAPTATSTVTLTVTPSPSSTPTPSMTATPGLPLSKSINVSVADFGDTITYNLTYTNDSSGTVTMVIWDTIPSQIGFVGCDNACSQNGGLVSWALSGVPAGASGTVKFWGSINAYPWLPLHGPALAWGPPYRNGWRPARTRLKPREG